MLLRPEQASLDAARTSHTHLSGRLLVAGVVQNDGSRWLERRLPNGCVVRLHDYVSIAHRGYEDAASYEALLVGGKAILGCDVVPPAIDFSESRPKSRLHQSKPVSVYQPHDLNPDTYAGFYHQALAERVPEGEYVAAIMIPRTPAMVPLLNPLQSDTLQHML
ncbi:MAG TPA: hypothetical protein VGE30_00320 [Candidatus Saccharimonadales bacterium]